MPNIVLISGLSSGNGAELARDHAHQGGDALLALGSGNKLRLFGVAANRLLQWQNKAMMNVERKAGYSE